jgi:uncharacterized membrane protein YidH (DUF202 family)
VAATVLCLLAVAVLTLGTRRYYSVSRDLERNVFHPTRSPWAVTTAVIVVFVVVPFLVL